MRSIPHAASFFNSVRDLRQSFCPFTRKTFRKLNLPTSSTHWLTRSLDGTRITILYFPEIRYSSNTQLSEVMVLPVPVAIAKIPVSPFAFQFWYAWTWYGKAPVGKGKWGFISWVLGSLTTSWHFSAHLFCSHSSINLASSSTICFSVIEGNAFIISFVNLFAGITVIWSFRPSKKESNNSSYSLMISWPPAQDFWHSILSRFLEVSADAVRLIEPIKETLSLFSSVKTPYFWWAIPPVLGMIMRISILPVCIRNDRQLKKCSSRFERILNIE